MFHQFYVSSKHRCYLRFLWWEQGDLESEPKEFQMKVHLFGAASSPGCANFGLKYLAHQQRSKFPSAAAFVENNFYVDDGLISVPTTNDATTLITEAQKLCKEGGLRLHKFNSNRSEVLDCVNPSERATSVVSADLKPDLTLTEHTLGMRWHVKSDCLGFYIDLRDKPDTRRGILSVIASLYDLLGFISPFIMNGKCILQDLCRRSIGWDDPLPEDLLVRWEKWKFSLQDVKGLMIQRCYHPQGFGKIVKTELNHFSDASSLAYGACSYLRFENDKGEIHCVLIMAKARVAPLKITTIPRLELTAAVVAARLSVLLKSELDMKIDTEFFWTDSQVVLSYINNEARRFHVFVANRVQIIRANTNPNQWNHVDTTENPADHASRGLCASEILTTNWLTDPEFLWVEERIPPEYFHLTKMACNSAQSKGK
ncbi:uncharacterized protein LOC114149792 [Xiphophorus couchianus]|uniref:uncharacterized protein LOC114149792 n=1 Tax=Xiphophorus couchianus TaxID=32473 RepID=UPI0010165B3B|nr:uncharacterized protein LOC114149792 [Xiphophorus couchianus]